MSQVIKLPTKSSDQDATSDGGEKPFKRRWGPKVAEHGFTQVPTMLFWMQARLGLRSPEMMVLLQILSHWFSDRGLPWPAKETLANRLGIKPRQVQRILARLETAGLVSRKPRYSGSGGQRSNAYDPAGLIERLKKIEPEYRRMKESAKAKRSEVEVPVGKRKAVAQSASK